MTKLNFATIIVISLTILASCNSDNPATTSKKSTKGKWQQRARQEFMRSCVASAEKSYEERGLKGDSAIITILCNCAGQIVEEKYSQEEAAKISTEESNAIVMQAAEKCLPKSNN